jgi:hypothetical protein
MWHLSVLDHPVLWGVWHCIRFYAVLSFFSSIILLFVPDESKFYSLTKRKLFVHTVHALAFFAISWRRNQISTEMIDAPHKHAFINCSEIKLQGVDNA